MQDAIIIICSRLESRRLPGKAIKKIAGITALDHILLRTKDLNYVTILAVPPGQESHFKRYCDTYKLVGIHTGHADSPLHRMAEVLRVMEKHPHGIPKWTVRITHDDILIDAPTIEALLNECDDLGAGYGYSPSIVEGAGVEVIRSENVIHAANKTDVPTEFISYFVKGRGLPYPKVLEHEPREEICRPYRLTMDYPEDALVLEIILRELGPLASLDTICRYLDTNKHILDFNRLPELSFYTCAKDVGPYIQDTMVNVLGSQVCDGNFEYIVAEDGSTDNTLSEIARFSGDKRLKLIINDTNLGLASSSNIALNDCRGKMVMRVDGDDLLIPGHFDIHYDLMKKSIEEGNHIVYPAYYEMDEYGVQEGRLHSGEESHHIGCALVDKRFLNEVRFKDGIRHWDGLELFQRVKSFANISYFNYTTWQYRKRPNSLSSKDKKLRASLKVSLCGLDVRTEK